MVSNINLVEVIERGALHGRDAASQSILNGSGNLTKDAIAKVAISLLIKLMIKELSRDLTSRNIASHIPGLVIQVPAEHHFYLVGYIKGVMDCTSKFMSRAGSGLLSKDIKRSLNLASSLIIRNIVDERQAFMNFTCKDRL